MLLLGAVLSADQERRGLPRLTRGSLEEAFCRAVNLSLEQGVGAEDGECFICELAEEAGADDGSVGGGCVESCAVACDGEFITSRQELAELQCKLRGVGSVQG